MVMNFAVSTTAFRRQPIEKILELAARENLNLEFSSGIPYREDMEMVFLEANVPRLPHNYFPAPATPFVLNLASLDDDTHTKSIEHCLKGVRLAAAVGAPFYSAHAGFCLDPAPEELGRKLKLSPLQPREKYWIRFVDAVRTVINEARKLRVEFLVENNVVAPFNLTAEGDSPLLCVEHGEIARLVRQINDPALGILLDTGHLSVSARSLDFSREEFMKHVTPHIRALHHSDNDTRADDNLPITSDYWFLKYMPAFTRSSHILEVHDQTVEQIKRQFEILEQAALLC